MLRQRRGALQQQTTQLARNIFNEPYLIMEKVGANAPVVQFYEVNGINWTCGIKQVF